MNTARLVDGLWVYIDSMYRGHPYTLQVAITTNYLLCSQSALLPLS